MWMPGEWKGSVGDGAWGVACGRDSGVERRVGVGKRDGEEKEKKGWGVLVGGGPAGGLLLLPVSSPSPFLTRAECEKGYPNVSPVVSAGSALTQSETEKGPLVPGREGGGGDGEG